MAENVMKLSDTQWNTEQVDKIPPNGVVVASVSFFPHFFIFSVLSFSFFVYLFRVLYLYVLDTQGSYPYNPYAMPNPNGVAEASVSFPPLYISGEMNNPNFLLPFLLSTLSSASCLYFANTMKYLV
jgi:hypothetical protein